MLVDFNDTKPLIIITVQDTLDAGGFSSSRISKQQTVVRLSAPHKSLRIFDQLPFGDFIPHQVIQLYMGNSGYGCNDHLAILIMLDAESFMQSKLSHPEILVKLHHICHKFLGAYGFCQGFAHIADTVPDPLVVHFAVSIDILIAAKCLAAAGMKYLIKNLQVKIIKFFKNLKITQCQGIDAALYSAADLAGCTERIFMIYQKLCQVIVPQVSGKAIHASQLHQAIYTLKELAFPVCQLLCSCFICIHQRCHCIQNFSMLKIAVKNAFLCSCHFYFLFLFCISLRCQGAVNSFPIPAGRLPLPVSPSGRFSPHCHEGFPQNPQKTGTARFSPELDVIRFWSYSVRYK